MPRFTIEYYNDNPDDSDYAVMERYVVMERNRFTKREWKILMSHLIDCALTLTTNI